jgi:hypothetical protein
MAVLIRLNMSNRKATLGDLVFAGKKQGLCLAMSFICGPLLKAILLF